MKPEAHGINNISSLIPPLAAWSPSLCIDMRWLGAGQVWQSWSVVVFAFSASSSMIHMPCHAQACAPRRLYSRVAAIHQASFSPPRPVAAAGELVFSFLPATYKFRDTALKISRVDLFLHTHKKKSRLEEIQKKVYNKKMKGRGSSVLRFFFSACAMCRLV
jgi:hypothetical protein